MSENPRKKILKSGKVSWEARYRDMAGRQRSRSFPLKRDAVEFLDEQRAAVRAREWIDPDDARVTLRALAEEAAELAPEPETRTQHRYYAKQLGDVGDIPVGRLRRADLQRWMNQLTEGRPWTANRSKLQPTTARNIGVWVTGLLKQAVRDRRIKDNPAEHLILPEPVDTVRLADIPTVEQVNRLIEVARKGIRYDEPENPHHPWEVMPHETFARMVGVMAGTGMRPSEIAGLRWRDVSLDKMTIDVVVQATKDGKGVKSPKTLQGKRVIPMSLDVATLLRQQRAEGVEGPEGTVFGTSRGARFNAGRMGDIYRKFKTAAGMGDLRLYSLRHFYASRLIASGGSVKAVSEVMGHKSPEITLAVYTHLWPGDLDSIRAASAGFLRDSCGIQVPGRVDNVLELRGQTG